MYLLFFYNTWLLTVCDLHLSHTGEAEGGIVRVKQEHEEVKWYCLLWNDLLFTLWVTVNALYFVTYVRPQLINNVNYKLSGSNGFIKADVKEECSSYFSNYSNNEGNPSSHLFLCCTVFIRVHLYYYITFLVIHLVPISQAVAYLNLFMPMKISLNWRMNLLRLVTAFCEYVRE